jgi:hypothetical protein
MNAGNLEEFLNKKVDEFNQPFFIDTDPVSIPHLFSKKQDMEIAGFFAAIFSVGKSYHDHPKNKRTDAANGYVAL